MGSLSTILPLGRLHNDEDDDSTYEEYPLAVVYSGPSSSDIPRIVPVDVSQIPMASIASHVVDESSSVDKSSGAKSGEQTPSEFSDLDGGDQLVELQNGAPQEHEISSELPECLNDLSSNNGGRFQDYMIPANLESVGSSPSSCSSGLFSGREEGGVEEEAPTQRKRVPVVTFRDDIFEEANDHLGFESPSPIGQTAVRRLGQKGTCYLCRKGNKLTDKEMCIVCGAKYCCKCLIRAMGWMPEGRKCVSCIGRSINEGSRKRLGKPSRMLRRIFPPPEVKRILEMEKNFEPELIYVNLQPLSQQEFLCLKNCQYPPKNLKPGNYWYDRLSGFWGKVGRKPCQIITPQLAVGGSRLQKNASNGNTNVLVNDREITRAELKMLQAAGVNCKGHTSLWVTADGSYQDEGMGIVKGKIWESTKVRVICAMLSLPVPPRCLRSCGDDPEATPSICTKALYKLLLMGGERSGSSTIFKQAKMIHRVPFTVEERDAFKSTIQCNLYKYLAILLEARETFERESLIEEITNDSPFVQGDDVPSTGRITRYSIAPRLKYFSDWLLQVVVDGSLESILPAATRENAPVVNRLWTEPGFQATYSRRHELKSLPLFASHFLERSAEIAMSDYEPSDADILYAEGFSHSKGVSTTEFSSPIGDHLVEQTSSSRFQLVRVDSNTLGGNCRRLEMFEDVDIVLFCVSITDYAEIASSGDEGAPMNKMMANKKLFETVVTHPAVANKKFLLVLSKFDLLETKLKQIPLPFCEWFHDFLPVISHNPSSSKGRSSRATMAHRAFQYVATKFKRLYKSLTADNLHVSLLSALESDNVDQMLRYAWEIIRWNEEESTYRSQEQYSTSIEDASS